MSDMMRCRLPGYRVITATQTYDVSAWAYDSDRCEDGHYWPVEVSVGTVRPWAIQDQCSYLTTGKGDHNYITHSLSMVRTLQREEERDRNEGAQILEAYANFQGFGDDEDYTA